MAGGDGIKRNEDSNGERKENKIENRGEKAARECSGSGGRFVKGN